ncbi:MAG: hypothetical protein V4772_18025 [Pseudomonadota bacterium]
MQSVYKASFERDMACTESDWLRWLPAAIGSNCWQQSPGAALIQIGEGSLSLTWQTASPRVIALLRLPRLLVTFSFTGLDEAARYAFMRRFDLYMQRGGG